VKNKLIIILVRRIHELIEVLVAESRKDDELINWEDAKKHLKKIGKL